MPSQRIAEVTFTPPVGGLLLVTAYFIAGGSGADWGSNRSIKVYCEQGGVTTYDGDTPTSNQLQSFTMLGVFNITGGSEVKCGLFMEISGASLLQVQNVLVRAEHIKR